LPSLAREDPMLIHRMKEGIRRQLLGVITPAVDQSASDRDVSDCAVPRLNRGRATSRLQDAPSWMSPMLILTTARATSGV
jgi:hypothetical protein